MSQAVSSTVYDVIVEGKGITARALIRRQYLFTINKPTRADVKMLTDLEFESVIYMSCIKRETICTPLELGD